MAARPFKIDRLPATPPSVEHTAEKYGVSKTALQEIKAFVSGFLNGDEPDAARSRMGRRPTLRSGARKSGGPRSSVPVRRTRGSGRSAAARKAARRKK